MDEGAADERSDNYFLPPLFVLDLPQETIDWLLREVRLAAVKRIHKLVIKNFKLKT